MSYRAIFAVLAFSGLFSGVPGLVKPLTSRSPSLQTETFWVTTVQCLSDKLTVSVTLSPFSIRPQVAIKRYPLPSRIWLQKTSSERNLKTDS